MAQPLVVDLPHRLGAEEAQRRIAGGIGKLKDQIPGGAEVESSWAGNRLNLAVQAMNQQVTAHIDVHEATVRVELLLPAALAFFGKPIEALLRRKGGDMLEDKSGGPKT
jgi:hypothetical protein